MLRGCPPPPPRRRLRHRRRPLRRAPPLSLAGEGEALSREQASSFWSLPSTDTTPRHGSGTWATADESLSGDGNEFDPATGWTYEGDETDPLLAAVAPAEVAPAPPIATAEELFGPRATGELPRASTAPAQPRVTPAPPQPKPQQRPTTPPATAPARSRGLEIPTDSGPGSPLSDAAAAMKTALVSESMEMEIDDEDDDDIVTSGHEVVVTPLSPAKSAAPADPGDDVDALLARGRELLSHGDDVKAVLLLRRAQRLQPANTFVQTWRELGERRLLQAHLPGAKPTQIPRLSAHRLDFWEGADELERQLLVAIDGKRTLARLMTAAPDDKLEFLLGMLASFSAKGWLSPL